MIRISHLPLPKIKKTSGFGMRELLGAVKWHSGIDLGIEQGQEVYSVADGIVRLQGNDPDGYGLYIVVEHNGFCTLYAHLTRYVAALNANVKAGDVIGMSGNTGSSTGPHLHFEIRSCAYNRFWEKAGNCYGHCIDPWPYIDGLYQMMSLPTTKKFLLLKDIAGLSDGTIAFFNSYLYRDDLAEKLLKATL